MTTRPNLPRFLRLLGAVGLVAPLSAEDQPILPPGPDATQQAVAGPLAVGAAPDPSGSLLPRWDGWSVHLQSTVVRQQHGAFTSPYAGPNSLVSEDDTEHTWTATAFIGCRPWPGGEVCVDPELAQGIGFGDTTGIAGFPNGEATRSASSSPKYYLARWFLRQTIGLDGGREAVEDDKNQVAGAVDRERLVVTIGRIAVGDIFDANRYAHDPRTQFLNWALFDYGAWDSPANARGYTTGAAVEWIRPGWALRAGSFMEPAQANGLPLDGDVARAHGDVLELELDHGLAGRPGKTRLLAFHNRAHMGDYATAIDDPALDLAATRRSSSKQGLGLNVEQELAEWAGVFLRLCWSDGRNETWAFTEIDRSAALGCALSGGPWRRPHDTAGVAGVANGLSHEHAAFLAAGGVGFIIGDGRLDYAPEEILEAYYSAQLCPAFAATLDYQFVANPGYNHDRGPVSIVAVRGHLDL